MPKLVRSEATVRAICELLQAGVTDVHEIAHRIFGTDTNPSISSLIRDLRSGTKWVEVSKDYQIPPLEHRNFTNTEVINAFCRYLEAHPEAVYDTKTYTAQSILRSMMLDQYIATPDDRKKCASILTQLRKRTAYTKISSQYHIQW